MPLQKWKLFSIVDLLTLLRIYGDNFAKLIHRVGIISAALANGEAPSMHMDLVISTLGTLDGMKSQLEEADLKCTVAQIDAINTRWRQYRDVRVFAQMCDELLRRLEDELKGRVLLLIPSKSQQMFDTPRQHWDEAIRRFPQITDNVEEMSRCFALCFYSASVFHSLLIVEAGLIELGKYIGVTDPKIGWDATCRRLAAICAAGYGQSLAQSRFTPSNKSTKLPNL